MCLNWCQIFFLSRSLVFTKISSNFSPGKLSFISDELYGRVDISHVEITCMTTHHSTKKGGFGPLNLGPPLHFYRNTCTTTENCYVVFCVLGYLFCSFLQFSIKLSNCSYSVFVLFWLLLLFILNIVLIKCSKKHIRN